MRRLPSATAASSVPAVQGDTAAYLTHRAGDTATQKTRTSERRTTLTARYLQSPKPHHERHQHDRHLFTAPQGRPIAPANLAGTFTTLFCTTGHRRIRIRFHDLRHSTDTLLLEQGVELVTIRELLGHAHIGVTATVYAHVRLRLQRNAIDALGTALTGPEAAGTVDGDEPPPCAAGVST
ncbi:tyrosine-type recombinase/integrase [Streptomyces sp. Act-28]